MITRSDCALWRQDVEFVASVYNVHLRREQVQSVEAVFKSGHLTEEELRNLQVVAAKGRMATAMADGDVNRARELLRDEGEGPARGQRLAGRHREARRRVLLVGSR